MIASQTGLRRSAAGVPLTGTILACPSKRTPGAKHCGTVPLVRDARETWVLPFVRVSRFHRVYRPRLPTPDDGSPP
jgi:hypothetical protein